MRIRNVTLALVSAIVILGFQNALAQDEDVKIDSLMQVKAEKQKIAADLKSQLNAVNGEINTLKKKIERMEMWHFNFGGILGADLNGFNNWAPKADLNSRSTSISFAYNGSANLIHEKYFWRNNGGVNLGWLRYDQNTKEDLPDENNNFDQVADVFNIQSLFGYNLKNNLSLSALSEYRTTILSKFNNPGYLDIGVGVTYTPVPGLVMVLHPLNYNIIFSTEGSDYANSLGIKYVIDYNTNLYKGVKWRSNLSGFLSYLGNDLSNYTWINGINIAAFKGFGVGIEFGLRWNPQEIVARELTSPNQTYYAIGLSYSL